MHLYKDLRPDHADSEHGEGRGTLGNWAYLIK